MLDVTLKLKGSDEEEDSVEVTYLSWINGGTYGPPALIAPVDRPNGSRAGQGDRVLFVNTDAVEYVEVERLSD